MTLQIKTITMTKPSKLRGELCKHTCPHCNHQNATYGDIGAAICQKCGEGYRTIPVLKFSDILTLNHNDNKNM